MVDTNSDYVLPVTIVVAIIVILSLIFVTCCAIRYCRKNKRVKHLEDDDDDVETDKVIAYTKNSTESSRRRKLS